MTGAKAQCELLIIVTSDIHGNIFPVNYGNNKKMNAGLSKIANLIKQVRNKLENIVLIDNGDLF